MTLQGFFQQHPRGALAFSGGADSSLLAWAAAEYGGDWRTYYVQSALQPAFELANAKEIAALCGLPLTVLQADVLQDPAVASNPSDRCYHCKRRIFSLILRQAAADGLALVIDGTNASDEEGDRPGMRALRELEVRSPLRECGLSKADVRRLSREAGLPTWDKPAYACLATRVPAGTALTAELLQAVDAAEETLRALGLRDFRVRLRDGGALVQVTQSQLAFARERRPDILRLLEPLVGRAELDETAREPSR